MAEPQQSAEQVPEAAPVDLVGRALRALQWLLSAHVTVARREARQDAARLVSALVLAGVGAVLVALALALGHAAAVIALKTRLSLSWPVALLFVAAADLLLALLFIVLCRARLAPPVLVETRAIARKAAAVLAGR